MDLKTVAVRPYTSKQMGDACEMLIAAELTLAGIPALKVPDNWPGYDVVAQPRDGSAPLRISVKSRTFKKGGAFVSFDVNDLFDWLAIVILPNGSDQLNRRIFLVPASIARDLAYKNKPISTNPDDRYWRIDQTASKFASFEDNFKLRAISQ
jgi:hypothetical protein